MTEVYDAQQCSKVAASKAAEYMTAKWLDDWTCLQTTLDWIAVYQSAIAERNAAQRELLEHTNHFADVRRIEEWLATTKPAHLAFTDGPERQVASHLEGLRQERDAARAECERLKKQLDQNDIAWARAAVPQIAKSEDQAAELTRLKADLASQNEAIRNMGNQFDQQARRNAATIAAMARRCEKCDEAVALLRRWYKSNWNCGPLPLATEKFIATLDAEEARITSEGKGC